MEWIAWFKTFDSWQLLAARILLLLDCLMMLVKGHLNSYFASTKIYWSNKPMAILNHSKSFSECIHKAGTPANLLMRQIGFNHTFIALFLLIPFIVMNDRVIALTLIVEALRSFYWIIWVKLFLNDEDKIDSKSKKEEFYANCFFVIACGYLGVWSLLQ